LGGLALTSGRATLQRVLSDDLTKKLLGQI